MRHHRLRFAQAAMAWSSTIRRATCTMRAARRCIARYLSDPTSTTSGLTELRTIEAAANHPDPDLLLLAALALGGLVHPADALAIALIEPRSAVPASDPAPRP